MPSVVELRAQQLYRRYDPERLSFRTTADLADLDETVGQPRVVAAMGFGTGIRAPGYNIFALGSEGTGRHVAVLRALRRHGATLPVPPDRCYVHNFADSRRPLLLELAAGTGAAFQRDMAELVDQLRSAIPAALESEDFQRRRQGIEDEFKEKPARELATIADRARAEGLGLLSSPTGFVVAAVRGDEVLSSEEFERLPEADRERLQGRMTAYQEEVQATLRHLPRWSRERHDALRALRAQTAADAADPLIGELRRKHESSSRVVTYLDAVRRDVVEDPQDFNGPPRGTPLALLESLQHPLAERGSLQRYRVNLLVDNTGLRGGPVIMEDNPSYENLVGRIEHVAQFGALATDFTLIKAGSLQRAHGGYLVLDARKLLVAPFAWEALKRALRARQARVEAPAELMALARPVTLEPEPAALDLQVVLLGSPYLYYLLSALDPEFSELFKVTADFDDRMPGTPENVERLARLIATAARADRLPSLDRSAVARLLEHSARLAGDQERLSARITPLLDLVREAGHWARAAGAEVISASHVEEAIEAQLYRADRPRERLREDIAQGVILIDTKGERVGQVNGLSVLVLGGLCFARPSRITARVRLGQDNVVDLEREVELGGPIHSKGVLILGSYLGAHYSAEFPLSLSASLVFEQSYADVEGDSASAAELLALLSALAEVPIRQGIAVTGSVNQLGEIQPVGSINEKIEGFFDACRITGLTGSQGVVIPAANQRHLMLRREVVDAVEAGSFHIYPVTTVDQALELVTGLRAASRDAAGAFPEGSVNDLVERRLRRFAETLRQFNAPAGERAGAPEAEAAAPEMALRG